MGVRKYVLACVSASLVALLDIFFHIFLWLVSKSIRYSAVDDTGVGQRDHQHCVKLHLRRVIMISVVMIWYFKAPSSPFVISFFLPLSTYYISLLPPFSTLHIHLNSKDNT